MGILYRQIEEKDNTTLAELIRHVFIEFKADYHKGTIFKDPTTDNLYEYFKMKRSICWVALENERIVGCCGVYPTKDLPIDCAELVKFYVLSTSRSKGIGKSLLKKCENSALELGYKQLYLESLPEFSNAVRMYKKAGFLNLSKAMGNSGHYGCNIWMIKDLK